MPDTLLNALPPIFSAHPELKLVILFGSAVTGQLRPSSDIDLAVQGEGPLNAATKMSLIANLATVTGRAIDLVDLHTVGAPLLAQILRHGKRLHGSDTAYAQLVTRHLADEADFLPYYRRTLAERREAWIGR